MPDLSRAVQTLVDKALSGATGRRLQSAVGSVVDAFDAADTKSARAALKLLDASVDDARGHASQVLHLTIGALVEAGASADVAWPTVARGLRPALEAATRFALACAKAARTQHVETALSKSGAAVAKKMPEEAASFQTVPSLCLAAVACLTRSAKVRASARADGALLDSTYALEDAIEEVGILAQALQVLDDEPLVVLYPAVHRGFRVRISEVGSNVELLLLLADALVGDPDAGLLQGERIDRRVVAAVRGAPGAKPPKRAAPVAPFHLVSWTALSADGTLRPAPAIAEHWIWFDGTPAHIPPFEGTRVVLLQEPPDVRVLTTERAFDALRPRVELEKKLSPADTKKLLAAMGKAAARAKRKQ